MYEYVYRYNIIHIFLWIIKKSKVYKYVYRQNFYNERKYFGIKELFQPQIDVSCFFSSTLNQFVNTSIYFYVHIMYIDNLSVPNKII